MSKVMKIGVFDSGIGGLSVANAIKQAMPEDEIIFKNDAVHVPYGSRRMDEVLAFCLPVLESLVEDGCACIVIACNTVSTNLIQPLRELLPVPLIAIEPMVKPAAEHTKSGTVAVCATPATLASERYGWLKRTYAAEVKVLEPDCSDWAALIEQNRMNEEKLRACIEPVLEKGADVVVLGCTHYHWIQQQVQAICADRAQVIQPEDAIVSRVQHVLSGLAVS